MKSDLAISLFSLRLSNWAACICDSSLLSAIPTFSINQHVKAVLSVHNTSYDFSEAIAGASAAMNKFAYATFFRTHLMLWSLPHSLLCNDQYANIYWARKRSLSCEVGGLESDFFREPKLLRRQTQGVAELQKEVKLGGWKVFFFNREPKLLQRQTQGPKVRLNQKKLVKGVKTSAPAYNMQYSNQLS